MHPLAILVVWKFLYFGGTEGEKFFLKKNENFLCHLTYDQAKLERSN